MVWVFGRGQILNELRRYGYVKEYCRRIEEGEEDMDKKKDIICKNCMNDVNDILPTRVVFVGV